MRPEWWPRASRGQKILIRPSLFSSRTSRQNVSNRPGSHSDRSWWIFLVEAEHGNGLLLPAVIRPGKKGEMG